MQLDPFARNERPSCRDQDRAGAIQSGIQGGEEAVIGHLYLGCRERALPIGDNESPDKYNPRKKRQYTDGGPQGQCRSVSGGREEGEEQRIHAVGERIDAHQPLDPARRSADGKQRSGEHPQRNQKQINNRMKALRRFHSPGNHEPQGGERKCD